MKMRTAVLGLVLLSAGFAYGKAPEALTALPAALDKAKAENKLIFIEYGREACGNCQALKSSIKKGQVKLPENEFVYVDLNCDDKAVRAEFDKRYKVNGQTLPFVVIADSQGNQLMARTGYGSAKDFQDLIKQAQKQQKKK